MAAPAETWQAWFDRHGAALLLYARQWAGLAEAEDLVQEAFVRFWGLRAGVEDPAAYLYRCLRHAAVDAARRRERRTRREQAAAGTEPSPAGPWFDTPLEQAERREVIEKALAALPEEQREVVVMKVWGELTFDQIGRVLDIPLNTAASRYRYALAALHKELAEEFAP